MSEDVLKLSVIGRELLYLAIFNRSFSDEEFHAQFLAAHESDLKSAMRQISEADFEMLSANTLSLFADSENPKVHKAFNFGVTATETWSQQQADELKKAFGKAIIFGSLGISMTMILLGARVAELNGQGASFYQGVPPGTADAIRSLEDGCMETVEKIFDKVFDHTDKKHNNNNDANK